MADFFENEKVYVLTNVSTSNATLSTYTILDGDVDLTVSNVVVPNPTVGMTFTIGNASTVPTALFACHPETKEAYTHLQQFTLTSSTASTFTFSPPIYITGARKNVCDSAGADIIVSSYVSTMIRFVGAQAASSYPQPLMYHRDAYTFATAALPLMDDAIRCVVKTYDGISLRVWEGSDIRNDEKLTRIDILFGQSAIRPQWGCRLIGTGV
jgi:hypothetical protein